MAKIHTIYFDINTGYYPGVNHGLASLAAAAKQEGHFFSFQHLSKKEPVEEVVDSALKDNPDVIGFSFSTNQRQYVENYSEAIAKRTDVLQIAGGIDPTVAPLDVLKIKHINGICIGEGEYFLLDLLKRIDAKKDISNIPSFWWKNSKGDIIKNPIQPLDPDLSKLPLPDYSIFDTENISKASSGWVAILVIRGCPYNCYYCCNHVVRNIYPKKENYFRTPSVRHAIKLIKNALNFYKNTKGISFADDLMTFNENWFDEFSAAYIKEIGLPYICNSRIECLSEKTVVNLKRSDCKTVYIGVESGDENIRKQLLNRFYSNDQIIDGFSRLKKSGIASFSYNIVGFPFETKEQMQETLEINKIIQPDNGAVFYFYPYPGTKLFEICKENNLLLSGDEAKKVSGYFEGPAIKLTNCSVEDCMNIYRKIRLFLVSQALVNGLKLPKICGKIFYRLASITPAFWVNILTKNSRFKFALRRFFYKYFFK